MGNFLLVIGMIFKVLTALVPDWLLLYNNMIIAIFKNKANSRRNGTSLSSQKAKLSEKHIVSRSEEHPG
ncbi:MAG: hypothetical protein MSB96_04155, partial [Subdoligranulum sp.]|nr:hypothetical protein [Subdoligranulum sp.]